MKKLLIGVLSIGMAFACNNAGNADKNNADSIRPENTPPVNRQGNTSMDTSTSLPSDTTSVMDSTAATHPRP